MDCKENRRILLVSLGVYHMHAITVLDPLGISLVGAYLQEHGFEVRLLHLLEVGARTVLEEIRAFRPRIVGFSCYTSNYRFGRELAAHVREQSDCSIVFGGIHATITPEIAREDCIDFTVRGEGEHTMLALAEALAAGATTFDHIPGLCFARGEELVDTGLAPRIEDLDALPLPLRDGLPMHLYKSAVPKPLFGSQRAASISASRGCVFDCNFCTTPYVLGRKRFSRSVDRVMDELVQLRDRFGTNALYFCDEDLAFDREWLLRLCSELERRRLGMSWYCFARISSVDPELLAAMEAGGCSSIGFGIESADATSLERIGKRVDRERIAQTLEWVSATDIYSIGFVMIGLPWQSRESIWEGARFLHGTHLDLMYLSYATPFRRTRLYEEAMDKGLIRVFDPDGYNNLAPVMDTEYLSVEELRQLSGQLMRHFYLRPRYLVRLARKLRRDPVPLLSVGQALGARLREQLLSGATAMR